MTPWIFAFITVELIAVGWIDLRTKKISNLWVLLNAFLSGALFLSVYEFSWELFLFPVGFVSVGFVLYLLDIMGAGDSKFLASLFLLIPPEYHLVFFEKLVMSTIVTGTTLLVFRIIKHGQSLRAFALTRYWSGIRDTLKSRFSYAPVIGLAWLLMGLKLWK